MKFYIKNRFFAYLFLAFVPLLAQFHTVDAAKPPFPLVNSIRFEGGICYLNAIMQSIFQNNQFCTTLTSTQALLGPTWGEVWKLWNNDASILSYGRGLPCAWNLHEYLRSAPGAPDATSGKALWFANQLLTNLSQEAGVPVGHYHYYERHRVAEFARTCHRSELQFVRGGSTFGVRNLYDSHFVYGSGLGVEAGIIVAPALNLIALIPLEDGPLEITERGHALLNDVWNQAKGTRVATTARLTGVLMGMATSMGEWHATAYSNNNGTWHLCNDDTWVQPVGDFGAMRAAMGSIVLFFNKKFEILTGAGGDATITSRFVSATPKMLFYEIEEAALPMARPAPALAASASAAPAIAAPSGELTIASLEDIYKIQRLIPRVRKHELENLETNLLARDGVDIDAGMKLTPHGEEMVAAFVRAHQPDVEIGHLR